MQRCSQSLSYAINLDASNREMDKNKFAMCALILFFSYKEEPSQLGVVAQGFSPSTGEAEAGGSEVKASLTYSVSSRRAWPIERNIVSKNKLKKKRRRKRRRKRKEKKKNKNYQVISLAEKWMQVEILMFSEQRQSQEVKY